MGDGLLKLTEKETIQRVLSEAGGNRKEAGSARIRINPSFRTFYYVR